MESKRGHKGIDNVLVNLGFEDAEELTAKATLAVKFNDLLEARGLSQKEAAAIVGMTQPKVSRVRRNKLQNISPERIMQALVRSIEASRLRSDPPVVPMQRTSLGGVAARVCMQSRIPIPSRQPTCLRHAAELNRQHRRRGYAGACIDAAFHDRPSSNRP